ncbi:MAG: hypothetical protein K2J73_10375, partial [Oscillospiraceae bacterium]|nr:hypothetical protein [Oscillospiraceae bacterium]
MNMKKTIAAIAAGAVAVSAMATTVSAVESKTLNYNLTATLENQFNGQVTLKATFPNVPLEAGKNVKIRLLSNSSNGWTDKIVVSGQYIDTNKAINPITFTEDEWTEGFSSVTAGMMDSADQSAASDYWMAFVKNGPAGSYGHEITIPVVEVNTGSPALIGGTAVEGSDAVAATAVIKEVNLAADDATTTSAYVASFAGLESGEYTVQYNTDKWEIMDGAFTTGKEVQVVTDGTVADGDTIVVTYTKGKDAVEGSTGAQMANIIVTATLKNINPGNNGDMGGAISAGKFYIEISTDNGTTYTRGDANYSGLTAATKYKMPFRTTLNDNVNILDYLQTANLIGDDKSYVNVKAVINDAIENYEGVTFTFNTAASKVKYVLATGSKTGNPTIGNTLYSTYDAAVKAATGSQWVTAVYNDDWDAVDTYTAFGEHTYDWRYAPETSGYTGFDWGGTNLFAGALVVNEAYTMSLSNTEYFDWTKTSISFDWEAIMDNAATTNNYATYVHSLKLATSNLWFWDSMDLVLTAGEADDVSADAGAEVDDATLDDDDDE